LLCNVASAALSAEALINYFEGFLGTVRIAHGEFLSFDFHGHAEMFAAAKLLIQVQLDSISRADSAPPRACTSQRPRGLSRPMGWSLELVQHGELGPVT